MQEEESRFASAEQERLRQTERQAKLIALRAAVAAKTIEGLYAYVLCVLPSLNVCY
jgi:hypothetical protein